uniref:Non-haem dioxygenase N-terminal domain-containing protein n=1 Tax=Arundo donax TaxID=35708 RepID=A0A0A9BK76_ARUDO
MKLGSAFQNWGFFQLINRGLPHEVVGNLMNDIV